MQNSQPGEHDSFIGLLRQFWSLLWSAFIEFVWSDLRAGMIDFRGFSRPVRAIVSLGILITLAGLLLLTQTPLLRATFPLYTSITPAPGRGLHIPLILFPLSLFLLTLAWAYLLVGARQCHWLIRYGVFFLYSLTVASWLIPLLATNPVEVAIALALYFAILLTYLLPQAKRFPLAFYFTLILACTGGLFVIVQYLLVQQDQASGLPIGKTLLESNLRSLATLAIPLLILIGIDIADFTIHAATWVTQAVTKLFTTTIQAGLALILLLWLLWQGISFFAMNEGEAIAVTLLYQFVGASALILLLWLCWALMARLFPVQRTLTLENYSQSVGKMALVIVIALLLPLLASFIFLEIAELVESLALALSTGFYGDYPRFATSSSTLYAVATAFSTETYQFQSQWQLLCALFAIVTALFLYRRQHEASALFAITFAINYLWLEFTRPGNWLQTFSWNSPEPMILAWVFVLILWSTVLLWRRQLIPSHLSTLLLAIFILILLSQTKLIASPFDPLFALAGVGYLAVGLGWDMLTAGSWANHQSTAMPRASRLFLYLGYILLTVMLVNWAVATHDFTLLSRFTGEAALTGLTLLGYPYLFSVLYLLLSRPFHSSEAQ